MCGRPHAETAHFFFLESKTNTLGSLRHLKQTRASLFRHIRELLERLNWVFCLLALPFALAIRILRAACRWGRLRGRRGQSRESELFATAWRPGAKLLFPDLQPFSEVAVQIYRSQPHVENLKDVEKLEKFSNRW